MKQIKIYQIEITRDCDYAFMRYDYAKDKINMDDYKLVAEYPASSITDDKEELDWIWIAGNNGTLQKDYKMRSVSVSDIIEIDNKKYYVDSFEFKEI